MKQNHLHRRILPAGKPVPVYIDAADTGYTCRHTYYSSKMGTNAGYVFIRPVKKMIIKISTEAFILSDIADEDTCFMIHGNVLPTPH
jgi:hypothetical protein